MRDVKVCYGCNFLEKNHRKGYKCNQEMDSGWKVDVVLHSKENFKKLPLYGNCPRYLEHIIIGQELI
jgi:hypothetical protein